MSKARNIQRLARLKTLAELQAQAARTDLAPFRRVEADLSEAAERLTSSRTDLRKASCDDFTDLRARMAYLTWCERALARTQAKRAKLRAEMAARSKALATAEAQRLVLDRLEKEQRDAWRKCSVRQAQISTGV